MELPGASSHEGAWVVLGMAVLFGAIGTIALAATGRLRLRQKQALSWPSVPGKITANSVSRHEDDESLWFHCDLRYQYSVDGHSYEGRALAAGGSSGDEKGANEEHRRYPLGSIVTVYHNPRKPQDAVLERDPVAKSQRVLLLVGGIFFFSALVLFAIYTRMT
ncbi:MAG TPA: DUF3592 domain-containing protein [Blastocatellia bacterium]